MAGRLRQLLEKTDRLMLSLRTFCLLQDRKTYDEICGSSACQRLDGFADWKSACEYKYGYSDSPGEFVQLDAKLSHRAVNQPSKSVAVSTLFVFYATGELKYIDLYYQMMGHGGLPISTRRELVEAYKQARELYRSKYPGVDACRRLALRPDVITFEYFESAVENAKRDAEISV